MRIGAGLVGCSGRSPGALLERGAGHITERNFPPPTSLAGVLLVSASCASHRCLMPELVRAVVVLVLLTCIAERAHPRPPPHRYAWGPHYLPREHHPKLAKRRPLSPVPAGGLDVVCRPGHGGPQVGSCVVQRRPNQDTDCRAFHMRIAAARMLTATCARRSRRLEHRVVVPSLRCCDGWISRANPGHPRRDDVRPRTR